MYSSVSTETNLALESATSKNASDLLIRKTNEIIEMLGDIESLDILDNVSSPELLTLVGVDDNMTLIVTYLNLISDRLTNTINKSRQYLVGFSYIAEDDFTEELYLQYKKASEDHDLITNYINLWNENKFEILRIIQASYDSTDISVTARGTRQNGGFIIRVLSKGIRDFVTRETESRGIKGLVDIKLMAKELGINSVTLIEYLLHYGVINYPHEVNQLVWDENMLNFLDYVKTHIGKSIGEKRELFKTQSSIYVKIRNQRLANQILISNDARNNSEYQFSSNQIFDYLVALNLLSVGYLSPFKRDLKLRLDLWENLFAEDVIVGGSFLREELRFSRSGVLKIINWYRDPQSPEFTEAIFDNRATLEEAKRIEEYRLDLTNERLASKLQDKLVTITDGIHADEPATKSAIEILTEIYGDKFNNQNLILNDSYTEEYIDTSSADKAILKFLKELISPNCDFDFLENKYKNYSMFSFLIQVYKKIISMPDDQKKQGKSSFQRIFTALYGRNFEDLYFTDKTES